MDQNGFLQLVDFVVNIREQDIAVFDTVFTVMAGTLLAAILALMFAGIANGGGSNGEDWYKTFVKLVLVGIFVYALSILLIREKHFSRRNYGVSWIADSNNTPADPNHQTAMALIQKFCSAYSKNEPSWGPLQIAITVTEFAALFFWGWAIRNFVRSKLKK